MTPRPEYRSSVFNEREERLVASLRNPIAVQRYLRQLPYNHETEGETLRTFRGVMRSGTAHCLEAVLFAATVLHEHGYPPLVLDIESADRLDHVLFLYQHRGRWGTVGRSRDWRLHGRVAEFRTIHQLVQSYMRAFVDGTGRVIGYGTADLDKLVPKVDWRFGTKSVWAVERALIEMPHRRVRMSEPSYRRTLRRFISFRGTSRPMNRRTMLDLHGPEVDRWL
ncbi:MAG: hypothetical protein ACT4OZ_14515 [Gemmatimonadota bacterium]